MSARYFPSWVRKRLTVTAGLFETKRLLAESSLNTVCEASLCPNLNDCFSRRTATILILGKTCTRDCAFCAVSKGAPEAVDPNEPRRISALVKAMDARYVVVTSVTRDDLADGGAGQFVKVIESLKGLCGEIGIEALVPDFNGCEDAIAAVIESGPNVLSHNIETVRRLYPVVRQGADYDRSLKVLKTAKRANPRQLTKSSLMVGLGEKTEEVIAAMEDLKEAGCGLLTLGQYLQPGEGNIPVERFVLPEEFKEYEETALGLGFKAVKAGTFVRSSYLAEEMHRDVLISLTEDES